MCVALCTLLGEQRCLAPASTNCVLNATQTVNSKELAFKNWYFSKTYSYNLMCHTRMKSMTSNITLLMKYWRLWLIHFLHKPQKTQDYPCDKLLSFPGILDCFLSERERGRATGRTLEMHIIITFLYPFTYNVGNPQSTAALMNIQRARIVVLPLRSVNCSPRAKSCPPLVLEIKFYWKIAPSIHLRVCSRMLSCCNARVT